MCLTSLFIPFFNFFFLRIAQNSKIRAPFFAILGQIKGYTAYVLRQAYIKLKKQLPTLWARSYYMERIGHIAAYIIKKYMDGQPKKEISCHKQAKCIPLLKQRGLLLPSFINDMLYNTLACVYNNWFYGTETAHFK